MFCDVAAGALSLFLWSFCSASLLLWPSAPLCSVLGAAPAVVGCEVVSHNHIFCSSFLLLRLAWPVLVSLVRGLLLDLALCQKPSGVSSVPSPPVPCNRSFCPLALRPSLCGRWRCGVLSLVRRLPFVWYGIASNALLCLFCSVAVRALFP